MASPLIYTGKGAAQALQGGSQSLQALGQYAQSQQIRKKDEVSKSIKDQDKLLEMLKLDPVYSASVGAQEKIAGVLDTFVNSTAKINQELKGDFQGKDLQKIQQLKSVAMGQLNIFKAGNEQMLQAQKAINTFPDRYYRPDFDDAVKDFQETGMFEDGLTMKYDPTAMIFASDESLQSSSTPVQRKDEDGNAVLGPNGETIWDKQFSYAITDEQRRQKGVDWYRGNVKNTQLQVNREWNDMMDDKTKSYYIKQAKTLGYSSGQEAYAADLGEQYFQQETSTAGRIIAKPKPDTGNKWFTYNGKRYWGTKEDRILSEEVLKNEGGLSDGKAIVFTPTSKNKIKVDADKLGLPEGTTGIPEDGMVDVSFKAVDGDRKVKVTILNKLTVLEPSDEAGDDVAERIYTYEKDGVVIDKDTYDKKSNWQKRGWNTQRKYINRKF